MQTFGLILKKVILSTFLNIKKEQTFAKMQIKTFIWGSIGGKLGEFFNNVQTSKERKMNINKIRSLLYKTSKYLGDVNAIQKGTIGKRIMRRAAGKASGKLMKKIFK
ncbi:hypothetical protein [Bacillus altitudinis]|uniref:hypothetical protein n=1 Tax=Bacillus altitudinis TaxID=293387 RepID=UPI003CED370F